MKYIQFSTAMLTAQSKYHAHCYEIIRMNEKNVNEEKIEVFEKGSGYYAINGKSTAGVILPLAEPDWLI